MLLAADVGNTNVKLGIFDGDNLKFKLRFSTDENKTSDELAVELYTFFADLQHRRKKSIDGAIISSVVPKFTYSLRSICDYDRYRQKKSAHRSGTQDRS